jgi:outer membrane lipoprotein SlyB
MKPPSLPSFARMPLALAFLVATAAFAQPAPAPHADCKNCGVVENVRQIETKGEASGLGAVAGGVLGGVVGHQFGSGRGNTVATIAGAGAGAYAGHQIEKNRNTRTTWTVSVKLDDGTRKTYSYAERPPFREGDRIKSLDGGRRIALIAR